MYPQELKYTNDHEWIRLEDGRGHVGVTDYAQEQLGDVVYVELPEVGRALKKGDQFGSIESVKAVSDLFCPAAGTVVEVNPTLADRPEAVNEEPHATWMIVLALDNPDDVGALLDAAAYGELVGGAA
jgi:glycine cleavage system H protein